MYVTFANGTERGTIPVPLGLVDRDCISATRVRTLRAGQRVFCEGDTSEFVYQVLEGVVRTSKLMANGRRQVLAFGYPDDIVGLSHDCRYHNDCEAVTPSKVLVLKKNACSAGIEREPALFDRLLKLAACEVSNMQEHFMMLGRKSAAEKMASFLLALASRAGKVENGSIHLALPMSRTDIADFLGLTVETVSRTLTTFRKKGAIELPNPHTICIVKKSVLCDLAEGER